MSPWGGAQRDAFEHGSEGPSEAFEDNSWKAPFAERGGQAGLRSTPHANTAGLSNMPQKCTPQCLMLRPAWPRRRARGGALGEAPVEEVALDHVPRLLLD
eukprot:5418875-Alexandrium_andersonii.AAC.1